MSKAPRKAPRTIESQMAALEERKKKLAIKIQIRELKKQLKTSK